MLWKYADNILFRCKSNSFILFPTSQNNNIGTAVSPPCSTTIGDESSRGYINDNIIENYFFPLIPVSTHQSIPFQTAVLKILYVF